MKCLIALSSMTLAALLCSCSVSGSVPYTADAQVVTPIAQTVSHEHAETMLLVSLDDGTVIKQTISVGADVCFKNNSDSSTVCLTQGDAIVDSATNAVIGFEMIENHIDLVAKTN